MDIVEEDERALFLKSAPDLRLGRFADLVAVVEGLEDLLLKISGRLMPCRQVHDAVHK